MTILPRFSSKYLTKTSLTQKTFRILIIRPGETAFDKGRHLHGSLALPLTKTGKKEAVQLAQELNVENIAQLYSSPSLSARETSEKIAKQLGIPQKVLKGLQNQNQGLWEGMRVEQIRRNHPRIYRQMLEDPCTVMPPNGEHFRNAFERLQTALQWILDRHRTGTVGLILNEPAASMATSWLKCEKIKNLWNSIGSHGYWESIEL